MQETSLREFFRGAPFWIKLRLVFLGLFALVVVLASGVSIVFILKASWRQTQEAERKLAAVPAPKAPSYTFSYEIREISLALTSKDFARTSYAQFSLVLDCPSEASHRAMELNRARLLDGIFEVGSDFHLEDFKSPEGFQSFKRKLTAKYKSAFGSLAPRQVALSDWLVQ